MGGACDAHVPLSGTPLVRRHSWMWASACSTLWPRLTVFSCTKMSGILAPLLVPSAPLARVSLLCAHDTLHRFWVRGPCAFQPQCTSLGDVTQYFSTASQHRSHTPQSEEIRGVK